MPNINLIAARREEKKRLERLTRQLFVGVSSSVGLFAVLTLVLGARQLQARSDLADANQKMQKLQPVLDRIKQIEDETNQLLPKVETLKTAKNNTLRWRAVLQVVSQSVPADTWLSNVSTAGGSEDISLNLDGLTRSHSLVGDTMTRLGAHPMFDKVDLKNTSTEGGGAPSDPVQRVRFSITAHLRQGGEPAAAEENPQKQRIRENLKARDEVTKTSQAAPKGGTPNG